MDKADMKKCKKTLNILRIAATDKENLTSKFNKKKMSSGSNKKAPKEINPKRNKKNIEANNKDLQHQNEINLKKNEVAAVPVVEVKDLTTDNPSETYWQNLAESRRKALDSALKENIDLHNKVNELEYENFRLMKMLEEAKSLVEVLTEMIEENNDTSKVNESDNGLIEESTGVAVDSDLDEMSFQSCS